MGVGQPSFPESRLTRACVAHDLSRKLSPEVSFEKRSPVRGRCRLVVCPDRPRRQRGHRRRRAQPGRGHDPLRSRLPKARLSRWGCPCRARGLHRRDRARIAGRARSIDLQQQVHEDMQGPLGRISTSAPVGSRRPDSEHRPPSRPESDGLLSACRLRHAADFVLPPTIYPATSWPGISGAGSCTSAS